MGNNLLVSKGFTRILPGMPFTLRNSTYQVPWKIALSIKDENIYKTAS